MAFKKFKTERILLASIGVLFLFLLASVFTKEIVETKVSSAEEGSGVSDSNSEENSQDNEGSEDDEDSQDNESSQDDEDSQVEESQDDEKSEVSVSAPSVQKTQTGSAEELSEKSSGEISQQSVEEISEASALSEESQEISEESIKYVKGYGEVVSKEGNVALVKKNKKLFFLIPVEVESRVTFGEQGEVLNEKKNFWSWLLSAFSV